MTTTNEGPVGSTLRYGARGLVPAYATAAWGARLIFPDDVVWDRTDCAGEPEEKAKLLAWLRGNAKDRPWAQAAQLYHDGLMTRYSSGVFALFEDAVGVVMGSPQGSRGYLYAVAWLRTEREQLAQRLDIAMWPDLAADIRAGASTVAILSRLRDLHDHGGEDTRVVALLVASFDLPDERASEAETSWAQREALRALAREGTSQVIATVDDGNAGRKAAGDAVAAVERGCEADAENMREA